MTGTAPKSQNLKPQQSPFSVSPVETHLSLSALPIRKMATFAARSVLRSATSSARTAATRLAAGAKPKAAPSPFRIPTQKPLTARIFRSPVEMSCAVETMLPYHTATASALLTSMLSATPRSYGWTLEGQKRTR